MRDTTLRLLAAGLAAATVFSIHQTLPAEADTLPDDSSTAEVFYTEDFDGGDRALQVGDNADLGWNFHKARDSSSAEVRDGRLHLTGSGYDTVHYTGGYEWTDYVFEADYAQETNAGWSGVLYRVNGGRSFQKAGVNLAGLAHVNGYHEGWVNDVYGINRIDNAADPMVAGQPMRTRIVVTGATARFDLARYQADGSLSDFEHVMTIDNIPLEYHAAGSVGLMANSGTQVESWIDNIEVREVTEEDLKVPPVQHDMAEIKVPETGIINPPAVVADTDAELTASRATSARPATVLMDIAPGLFIEDAGDGAATVQEFLKDNARTVIPAFRVDNAQEAAELGDHLAAEESVDAFVVASAGNAELVRSVRTKARTIRGAVELADDAETLAERRAAQEVANTNLANVVIVPGTTTSETVSYFNHRMITLWSRAESTADIFGAIAAGSNAVIADPETTYSVYESITEPTVAGRPIALAHRGWSHRIYPENTVLAFNKAYDAGIRAIEIDLRLTSDDEIVLMHDSTVDRTVDGQTGPVNSFTAAQLRQMTSTVGDHSDNIPMFEDALDAFQDKDAVFIMHINIGAGPQAGTMAERINELLDTYDMRDRAVAFYSYWDNTTYTPENLPGLSFASGSNFPVSTTHEESALQETLELISPVNNQPFPYLHAVAKDWGYYYKLSARGLLSWTSTKSTQREFDDFVVSPYGVTAGLIDYPQWHNDLAYAVTAADQTVTAGDEVILDCKTVTPVRTVATTDCSIAHIEGDAVTEQDGRLIAAKPGTTQVVLHRDLNVHRQDRELAYRVYSEPITVTVDKAVLDSSTPQIAVAGPVKVGANATVVEGDWTEGVQFSYQWFADGQPIADATGKDLRLVGRYKDTAVTVEVTGTLQGYDPVTAESDPVRY